MNNVMDACFWSIGNADVDQGYHFSGNLEMSGNSAQVREKAQSERSGNLCSQGYLIVTP